MTQAFEVKAVSAVIYETDLIAHVHRVIFALQIAFREETTNIQALIHPNAKNHVMGLAVHNTH